MEGSSTIEVGCCHSHMESIGDPDVVRCSMCGAIGTIEGFMENIIPNGKRIMEWKPEKILRTEKKGFGFQIESKDGKIKNRTCTRRKRKYDEGQRNLL